MSAKRSSESIYTGIQGYVSLELIDHKGSPGCILKYSNPNPAKLHAVDTQGMLEMEEAVSEIESRKDLQFCIFTGAYDQVHSGADITEFHGDCDVDAISVHLLRGTSLDTRIKALWPRMRTVGVFTGDRYGGSVEWPMFAEWGICDKDSSIQLTEVQLGIIPGWNGVLNLLLKCGRARALYMGQTGNRLSAEEMLKMGLVQAIADTPDVPARAELTPEEWNAAWRSHAEAAEPLLIAAALKLATAKAAPKRKTEFSDTATGKKAEQKLLDALKQEIAERTNVTRYRELHDQVAKEASRLRKAGDTDGIKALAKAAAKDVSKLGKPLAPLAVRAVGKLVDEFDGLSHDELLLQFGEAGQLEAELCVILMETEHRRTGVNAVLSRRPEDKVSVFD